MKTTAANSVLFSIVAVVLFAVAPCIGQDAITAKVDDLLKTEMQKNKVPGLSLAVVKNGQIVLAKGYGLANDRAASSGQTRNQFFKADSVGKQFAATAVMMLVEEGK